MGKKYTVALADGTTFTIGGKDELSQAYAEIMPRQRKVALELKKAENEIRLNIDKEATAIKTTCEDSNVMQGPFVSVLEARFFELGTDLGTAMSSLVMTSSTLESVAGQIELRYKDVFS